MFEISTVTSHTDDYDACTEAAKQEQDENARPELTASVENIEDYNIIFLGSRFGGAICRWQFTQHIKATGFLLKKAALPKKCST